MDAGNDRGLFLAITCLACISDSLSLGPWIVLALSLTQSSGLQLKDNK